MKTKEEKAFCDIDWGYMDIVPRLENIIKKVKALSYFAQIREGEQIYYIDEIDEAMKQLSFEDDVKNYTVKLLMSDIWDELEYIIDNIKATRGDKS